MAVNVLKDSNTIERQRPRTGNFCKVCSPCGYHEIAYTERIISICAIICLILPAYFPTHNVQ